SAAVYGNGPIPMKEDRKLSPLNSYASSKCMIDKLAEKTMKEKNISIIGLRYFNVYGPKEAHKGKSASMIWQLSRTIKEKRVPRIFKDGEQSRDFIYVKDVVSANIRAMESKERGIFNIGTGKSVTFNRIIKILNEIFGTSFRPEYFDNPYNFYQNHTQADTNLSSKILKWKSRFSIEDGIKDYFPSIKI
ncbi:MAG: NAD-dependent epimerase/dehydratase family protein, partial [Candidatus Omnitrophica bacterium]|nr:NAD-dependent epimerase/dehydratase family protein [Candidatus Omnitrophota bacterium]